MTTKLLGAEWTTFMASTDPKFWPEDAYYEDAVILVNGVNYDDIDPEIGVLPDDVVTITGGIVYVTDAYSPTLEAHFKKWKKAQTTTTFVVQCDIASADALRALIVANGGKVVS